MTTKTGLMAGRSRRAKTDATSPLSWPVQRLALTLRVNSLSHIEQRYVTSSTSGFKLAQRTQVSRHSCCEQSRRRRDALLGSGACDTIRMLRGYRKALARMGSDRDFVPFGKSAISDESTSLQACAEHSHTAAISWKGARRFPVERQNVSRRDP